MADTNEIFRKIFESSPDLYLLLSPGLVIIDASDAYLNATLTKRQDITGHKLFDLFPDNPQDPNANGVTNLSASLSSVLQHKSPHSMPVQKYDIPAPGGIFEERFWKPLNSPVFDENGEIIYIIHKVEDVTSQVLAEKEAAQQLKEKWDLKAAEKKHIENLKESEARFFKIFNLSPVATLMAEAATGKLICINRAFENLFGLTSVGAVGKTLTELNINDEKQRDELRKQIADHGGRLSEFELEVRVGSGEMKSMLISLEQIEVDNRKCFLVVMVDISQRKHMETALNKANHFLDTILENIPDMVFVKNANDLRFVRFNKAGERLLGFSSEDLIGKNDYDFFPAEQADFFVSKDRAVLDEKKLFVIDEEPIKTKYGERWLHTKKIPIMENGTPIFLVGISADITEQKKHQDAILQLNKELEAFSYSVSHDLRTPLRAISGYSQILEEDYSKVVDEEGRRLLKIISGNAVKMGVLIDDLLRFSRLGRKELQKKQTDMQALAEAAVAEITKGQAYNTQVKIDIKQAINSDESLMRLVLINLISNALKYSSKKESPTVEIKSVEKDGEVIFSVKDNGVGLDMRYLDKLFGVFQRLHSAEEFEGTGVGLAIVQRIISKHGGRVWAEGVVNEGATLYFSIPNN
jgi:PAS domain S-box-containing protein